MILEYDDDDEILLPACDACLIYRFQPALSLLFHALHLVCWLASEVKITSNSIRLMLHDADTYTPSILQYLMLYILY